MKRRNLFENGAAGGLAALVAACFPGLAAAAPRRYPQYAPPPPSRIWLNDEPLGEVTVVTAGTRRHIPEHGYTAGIFGTLILQHVNFPVLRRHYPLGSLTAPPVTLKVEVPHPGRDGLPPVLLIRDARFADEGWGVSEDDLTHELSLTYVADGLEAVQGEL